MKAQLINGPGKTSIAEYEQPSPQSGEVLLHVRLAGYCGSDLSTFRGKNPLVSYPRIPGHEIAATIEAVGEGVPETCKPGMPVSVSPYTACGKCPSCRQRTTRNGDCQVCTFPLYKSKGHDCREYV